MEPPLRCAEKPVPPVNQCSQMQAARKPKPTLASVRAVVPLSGDPGRIPRGLPALAMPLHRGTAGPGEIGPRRAAAKNRGRLYMHAGPGGGRAYW